MQIKNNILKIVLVSLLTLGFTACDDNESSSMISSEKKVKLPKPEWDSRLSDVEPDTGKWFQLANDDEIAAYNIANTYRQDLKDNKKAIEWYLYSDSIKTINQNLVNMASSYKDLKNYDMAIKYYTQAYLAGDKKAAEGLALLYEINLNDYKKAENWYKKAIERDSISAIKNIGLLYHDILKDDIKTSAYYIALIDIRYTKELVLKLLQEEWKIPNETIKKGYELQLTSDEFPIKYKGKLDLNE